MKQIFCFHCKKKSPLLGVLGRRDECPFCKSDLHVCKNCLHYDTKSYNECREPSAEVIKEKEKANFCDYMVAKSDGDQTDQAAQLKAAAEALFKK